MKIFKSNFVFMLLLFSISPLSLAGTGVLENTDTLVDDGGPIGPVSLPEGIKVLRDVSYGADALQRIDVYIPHNITARGAPVIFMVHGGAWQTGDKAMKRVVENKVARWVPKGFIFISANYRMLPDTDPLVQADDVARALGFAQSNAHTWGGDGSKFIIMGHSAGAHLVSLLSANPSKAYNVRAKSWLGTVSLDSAALDLVEIMQKPHAALYDNAFGSDPAYWQANSPAHVLTPFAKKIFAVCSTQRQDKPCANARTYADKSSSMGVPTKIFRQDLSHSEVNEFLGLPGAYTEAVEEFMSSLDAKVAALLRK